MDARRKRHIQDTLNCFTVFPIAGIPHTLFWLKLFILYFCSMKHQPHTNHIFFSCLQKKSFFFPQTITYSFLTLLLILASLCLLSFWVLGEFLVLLFVGLFSGKWIFGFSFLLLRDMLFVHFCSSALSMFLAYWLLIHDLG